MTTDNFSIDFKDLIEVKTKIYVMKWINCKDVKTRGLKVKEDRYMMMEKKNIGRNFLWIINISAYSDSVYWEMILKNGRRLLAFR